MEVFILLKNICDYLFIDTYESNKIQIGMNEMSVNNNAMSMRWNSEA